MSSKNSISFIVLLILLMIFLVPSSLAACNQTISVLHDNQSLSSSNYNMTVTETCGVASANTSFGVIGGVYSLFSIFIVLGLIFARRSWIKTLLTMVLVLLMTALVRFSTIFVEVTNPELTTLISTLNAFYNILVGSLYPLAGIGIVIVIIQIALSIIDWKRLRKRKKNDWEAFDLD